MLAAITVVVVHAPRDPGPAHRSWIASDEFRVAGRSERYKEREEERRMPEAAPTTRIREVGTVFVPHALGVDVDAEIARNLIVQPG